MNSHEIESEEKICFVLMPISDPDGYPEGHFRGIYENIFKPACSRAGYKAVRADDVAQTNLIHLDILHKLLDAPMALCDLSAHNPNTLFELGIRQSFDKPVVLVQEVGTRPIFDIGPLRHKEYRRRFHYEEVVQDQEAIAAAILDTESEVATGRGINSIVKLLSLSKSAELKESIHDPLIQLLQAEVSGLRQELREGLDHLRNRIDFFGGIQPPKISKRLAELPKLEEIKAKYQTKMSPRLDPEELEGSSDGLDDDIPF